MRTTGATILMTGGGSGIGRALARRFAALGNDVIVAGRRADALAETARGHARIATMTFDAGDAADTARFAREAIAAHPTIDVLFNNAGVMRLERAGARRDLGDAEETVATNLLGPIRLIDAFVDHLRGRPDAAIVNVTSGLAFAPLALAPTYSASKAAVHAYTVALREALRGSVEVIELAPPGVQTDLTPGHATREGYLPLDAFVDEAMRLFETTPTPAEVLVERVRPLRFAEAEGRFEERLAASNAAAEAAWASRAV